MVVSLETGSLETGDGPVLEVRLRDVARLQEQKEVPINRILADARVAFPRPDPDLLRRQ